MRIFITGATGFVGSAIVSDLLAAGYAVTGLARSDDAADSLIAAGANVHRGDLTDLPGLRRGAEQADAVIHAAFDHDFSRLAESCEMDRLAIEALGNGLEGSERPLIVTSGLPVIAGRVATEDDVPPAGAHGMPRISEQTALALSERGIRPMVVRMPQVHDRTRQGFASYLLDHAREKGISVYVGEGLNRWPTVHRLDAAALYRHVLKRGVAGRCYHAVAEEAVPVRAIAEAIGQRLGIPTVSLSAEESPVHFGWLDRVATMDVPASSVLTQEQLGWVQKVRAGLVADLIGGSKN